MASEITFSLAKNAILRFPCASSCMGATPSPIPYLLCRRPLADCHWAALHHQSIKAAGLQEENYFTYFQHPHVKSALRRGLPDAVPGISLPFQDVVPSFIPRFLILFNHPPPGVAAAICILQYSMRVSCRIDWQFLGFPTLLAEHHIAVDALKFDPSGRTAGNAIVSLNVNRRSFFNCHGQL